MTFLPPRLGTLAAAILAVLAASAGARAQVGPDGSQAEPEGEELAFATADRDGNGYIDEAEFAGDVAGSFSALDSAKDDALMRHELEGHDREAFAVVDTDGDDRLTFPEVMAAKMKDFRAVDRDKDGRIALDEYLAYASKP